MSEQLSNKQMISCVDNKDETGQVALILHWIQTPIIEEFRPSALFIIMTDKTRGQLFKINYVVSQGFVKAPFTHSRFPLRFTTIHPGFSWSEKSGWIVVNRGEKVEIFSITTILVRMSTVLLRCL